ncbi:AAA family ATPase [Paenibacillus sp. 481]|nr:AAA family ATPase [Paenibacillus sp. 481]
MVLILFLFFVYLIKAAVIVTSLQAAATNAVKQVAAHMYPVQLATANIPPILDQGPWGRLLQRPPAMMIRMAAREMGQALGAGLPPPISEWVQGGTKWAEQTAQAAGEQGQALVGEATFKPLLSRYGIQGVLHMSKIRVTHLKLPDLQEKLEPFIALEVEYDLPMRVPLLMSKLTLSVRATERVWIGDGPPPNMGDTSKSKPNDKPAPQISTLSPDPLKPGQRATLTAKAAPNERVQLVVFYKSGQSEAKHIGWATAGPDGTVTWDWHVSGNTTAGTWRLVVRTEDGRAAERMFNVKKESKTGAS